MDAIIILVVFGLGVLLPFYLFKLWWWFWFWVTIATALAIFELVCFLKTGKTISQRFWAWRKNHPLGKWIVLAGLIAFWTYLILHLFLEI